MIIMMTTDVQSASPLPVPNMVTPTACARRAKTYASAKYATAMPTAPKKPYTAFLSSACSAGMNVIFTIDRDKCALPASVTSPSKNNSVVTSRRAHAAMASQPRCCSATEAQPQPRFQEGQKHCFVYGVDAANVEEGAVKCVDIIRRTADALYDQMARDRCAAQFDQLVKYAKLPAGTPATLRVEANFREKAVDAFGNAVVVVGPTCETVCVNCASMCEGLTSGDARYMVMYSAMHRAVTTALRKCMSDGPALRRVGEVIAGMGSGTESDLNFEV